MGETYHTSLFYLCPAQYFSRCASLELVRHGQAAGLPLCGAEPSRAVLQGASQDGDPQAENPDLVQNNHHDVLSGENISRVGGESVGFRAGVTTSLLCLGRILCFCQMTAMLSILDTVALTTETTDSSFCRRSDDQ